MLEETHTVSLSRKILHTKGWQAQNIWELDVFSKQSIIPGFDQEKLFTARIGMVGVGGTGTPYSLLVARTGVGYQEICDEDKVNRDNLNRQLFYPKHIDKFKTLAWLDLLQYECPAPAKLVAYPYNFPDVLEAYPNAFSTVNILACMVDNHQARYDVARFGLANDIPVIFTGITREMDCGSVHVQEPGGPCFGCFKPPSNVENPKDEEKCVDPAVIDIHATIIGIAVRATLSKIMGWELPWNYYYFHFNGNGRSGNTPKNPDCEICGGVE